jgi:small-conductance mechanosensitive channel
MLGARLVLVLAFLALVVGNPVQAQVPAEPVPLELAGRTVFQFRAPRSAYSPQQRRTAATALLEDVLAGNGALAITSSASPEGVRLLVDGREVFSVLAADVDELAGETLAMLSSVTAARLEQALAEVRESESPARMLIAGARSLGWLAAGGVLAWLLLRNLRRLQRRLGELGRSRGRGLEGGARTLWEQNAAPLARGLATLFVWAVVAVLAVAAIERSLLEFPYTRPVGERLASELLAELRQLLLELVESLPGLVVVVLIFSMARFGAGVAKRYFQAAAAGEVQSHLADAVTPLVAERLVTALLWLGALVVAFPYIPGSGTGAFQGVTVFAGLMVSLGSTSVIGQMASGIVLAYSRAFRVGDYVRFGEHEGTVVSFNLLASKLRTNRNEEISVPNSLFTSGTTVNYSRFSREDGTFLATKLTLGYDIPWRAVHELLLGAARRTDGLRPEPPPYVLQTSLSDFYIEYELRAAVVEPARRSRALAELLQNVLDDFDAAHVPILSPHHSHLHGAVHYAPPGAARPDTPSG